MTDSPAERRYRERMALNDLLARSEARTGYRLLEATGLSADALWERTGYARCDDCQHLMQVESLVSLPEHRCSERQQKRREAPRDTP